MAKTYDELSNYGVDFQRVNVEGVSHLPHIETGDLVDDDLTKSGAIAFNTDLGAVVASSDGVNYDITLGSGATPTLQEVLDSGNTSTTAIKLGPLAASTTKKIVFFGDSYTDGTGASSTDFRYSTLVSNYLKCTEVNRGVGGSTLSKRAPIDPFGQANAVDRVATAIPTYDSTYHKLVIFYGGNDVSYNGANYTTANFKTDYQTVLDAIFAKGWAAADIIMLSPFYIQTYTSQGGNPAADATRNLAFGVATSEVAATNGCTYIDIYDVTLNSGAANLMDPADGLHANNSGHDVIAREIIAEIGYTVKDNGQILAAEGVSEFSNPVFTITDQVVPSTLYNILGVADTGHVVILPQHQVIRDITALEQAQGSSIWLEGKGIFGGYTATTDYESLLVSGGIKTDFIRATTLSIPSGLTGKGVEINNFSINCVDRDTSLGAYLGINTSNGVVGFLQTADDGKGQEVQITGALGLTKGISVRGVPTFTNTIGGELYYNAGFVIDSFNRTAGTGQPMYISPFGANVSIGAYADNSKGKVQITGNTWLSGSLNFNDKLFIANTGKMTYEVGGAADIAGVATLSGGTVTVNTTAVLTASKIRHSVQTATNPGFISIANIVNGTSFDIISSSGTDASTVFWEIVETQ